MNYLIEHTVFFNGDFSLILILAICVLISTVAVCHRRISKLKKKRDALRERERKPE